MANSARFFNNKECQYFPCHAVKNEDDFNCKFCYCPLYTLGDKCGGNFSYFGEGDFVLKDCSNCMVPHQKDAADYIDSRFDELRALAALNREEE